MNNWIKIWVLGSLLIMVVVCDTSAIIEQKQFKNNLEYQNFGENVAQRGESISDIFFRDKRVEDSRSITYLSKERIEGPEIGSSDDWEDENLRFKVPQLISQYVKEDVSQIRLDQVLDLVVK